jgi:hypothetical protein
MIVNSDDAKLETIIKFSRWALVNSDSRVNTVIPIIPFIGVLLISSHHSHHDIPDLVRHIGEEFRFTPICHFRLLPRDRVLFNALP